MKLLPWVCPAVVVISSLMCGGDACGQEAEETPAQLVERYLQDDMWTGMVGGPDRRLPYVTTMSAAPADYVGHLVERFESDPIRVAFMLAPSAMRRLCRESSHSLSVRIGLNCGSTPWISFADSNHRRLWN